MPDAEVSATEVTATKSDGAIQGAGAPIHTTADSLLEQSPTQRPMPGVPSDPVTRRKYDNFWGKYKVEGLPDLLSESLNLWHPDTAAAADDNVIVSREAQRALKKDKKSKDKEKTQEEEACEDENPKPKPKAKGKAKAAPKTKAKAEAKAKAKAKGKAKAKAKGQAKAKGKASREPAADMESGDDAMGSTTAQADEVHSTAEAGNNPHYAEEPATHPKAEAEAAPDTMEDKGKACKRLGMPSFARRVCPKTDRAANQWFCIRDTFNSIVRPRVDYPSTHEDTPSPIYIYI